MEMLIRSFKIVAIVVLLAGLHAAGAASDAGLNLKWDHSKEEIQADVQSAPLQKLLPELARLTGWRIYVEPGLNPVVSAKFKSQPTGSALRFLLGDLNFALVPNRGRTDLLIYRTSASDATERVSSVGTGRIENELIVSLDPASAESIEDLARRLDADVIGKIEDQNAYRLQFEDAAAAEAARKLLESEKDIAAIDSNYRMERPLPEQLDALASGGLPPKLRPMDVSDSDRIIVGLLDTSLQPLGPDYDGFLLPSIDVSNGATLPVDTPSHGASMAQTILQGLNLASAEQSESPVRILPINIYGPDGATTTFEIAHGIYAAVDGGATIINLSLGGNGDSGLLQRIIQQGRQQGVLFFGSAGNYPTTDPTYPAAYPEVVAVTAGDRSGAIAPYANRGEFVDVVAPGVSVVHYNGQRFFVSGTSTATAYVTGAAAGFKAKGQTADEVDALIRTTLSIQEISSGK